MQLYSDNARRSGKKIAFIPTMGFLHEGHLSLIREGCRYGEEVVVSIFVNPTQFGPTEDLDQYPRAFEKDCEVSEKSGATVIFAPEKEMLYGDNYQTYVNLEKLPNHLCGLSRPVFFRGVATIVTKLFNIVKPHVAVFGEKDYQQLLVIRRMVKDLNFDIKIIGAPLVRESDGLAMSSRNSYLSDEQRKNALCLYLALQKAGSMLAKGIVNAEKIIDECRKFIEKYPETDIDYVSICDPETLDDVKTIDRPVLMALAVKIGTTRLIDNMMLTP